MVDTLHVENVRITMQHHRGMEHEVLGGFSVSVAPGQWVCIIGDSGGGKSTLLHYLSGILFQRRLSHDILGYPPGFIPCKFVSGRVTLLGADITDHHPRDRNIGLVSQQYAVLEHLTVEENIALPLLIGRRKNTKGWRHTVRSIAEKLKIDRLLNTRAAELSGGENRRVAIGKMLVMKPALVLLDEAFGQLDPLLEDEVITDMRKQFDTAEVRPAYLSTTHNMEQLGMADTIILVVKEEETTGLRRNSERLISRWHVFTSSSEASALKQLVSSRSPGVQPWAKKLQRNGQ